MCVCVYVYVYVYVHLCVCVCACVCMDVCVCVKWLLRYMLPTLSLRLRLIRRSHQQAQEKATVVVDVEGEVQPDAIARYMHTYTRC